MTDRSVAEGERGELAGVSGWLLLFAAFLVIVFPLSTMYQLHKISGALAKMPQSVAVTLVFLEIALVTWGIWVGICLWQRRERAHREAETYLIVLAGLKMCIAAPVAVLTGLSPFFLPTLLMTIVWYAYLMNSRRVFDTFGPLED